MLISVLGAGSWGSALAIAFSNVATVKVWSRNIDQVALINQTRTNPGYLPDNCKFPDSIKATTDFTYAIESSELLIIAAPVSAMRLLATQIARFYHSSIPDTIWVCKGFEVGSGLLPHQIIKQVCPTAHNVGALLGPSFACEVANQLPTAITLASNNLPFALHWSCQLKGIPNFRIYANQDLIGSEVGAGEKYHGNCGGYL